jgi:hypothetical protein
MKKMGLMILIVTSSWASQLMPKLELEAKQESKSFSGFSPSRGRAFYFSKHKNQEGGEISCTTCHGLDPKVSGRTRANKEILPMAPVINPARFADQSKVEKWFKRNCQDVLQRPCSALEKGDFVSYMLSIK